MRLKNWHKKQKALRESLKNTYLHRLWGRRIFHYLLWRTGRRAIAGGLALGLFVAFTPTLGAQMLLAVCGAMYFKVNLPIALAACWITNPLTALPIYTAAWKLGKYLLENSTLLQELLDAYKIKGRAATAIRQGIYLWTGSLIFSTASALIANVAVKVLWTSARKIIRTRSRKTTENAGADAGKQEPSN